MRDELDAPFLDEWLHETEVTPPDPKKGARRVASQLPQIRQVGRWLPFLVFRRKAQTPTTTDTAEYQPSPIPASNGHTPTVIGRTQSMLSPVKAITVGAIVFAIGGVMLVAQPFQQQSNVPGAATEDVAATSFTGQMSVMDWSGGEEVETEGGLLSTGSVARVRYESSDPRLTGDVTITGSHISDPDQAGYAMLSAQTYELTNDEGSWLGEGTGLASSELGVATDTFILVGQDGYEGLTAYVLSEDPGISGNITISGIIFPSAMPEAPERTAAE